MTVGGTVEKTGVLALLVIAGATWAWRLGASFPLSVPSVWAIAAGILSLLLIGLTAARPHWAELTAPGVAATLGYWLGGMSLWLDGPVPGPAIHSVALTLATLVCFLAACRAGLGNAASKARLVAWAGLGALVLCVAGSWLLGATGVRVAQPPIGLAVFVMAGLVSSLVAIHLAASLDVIQKGVVQGAPKSREWYLGLGLIVTLVWAYLLLVRMAVSSGSRE